MNLLIDCHVFDSEFQGSRTVLKGLYSKLFELENRMPSGNIYFLAGKDLDNLKKEFKPAPFISYVQLKTSSSWKRLLFEFPYLIRKHKIDYAHFQYVVPPIKLCKYIVTCHDVLFMDFPQYFSVTYRFSKMAMFKFSYRFSDVITTVSNYSHARISHYFGSKPHFYVISNGVDESFFDFQSSGTKLSWLQQKGIRPYILYVSRFEPRKNHLLLLQVYNEKQLYKDVDLVLIGSKTHLCADFEKYYNELPEFIKSTIHINQSGVSQKEMMLYMKHAEVFVYPSIAEGFGFPPLEAASLKTPVICNNSSSMADFAILGRFLTSINIETLSKILKQVLQEGVPDEEKDKIASEIRANYSWNTAAIKFQSILAALN